MFKSTGKLIYSPRSHLGNPTKWLILSCDDNICRYYASLFHSEYPYYPKLNRPIFGAHISVIRGEKIPNSSLWGLDNNKLIDFEYEPGVLTNGEYFWLKVKCDRLKEIRELYGLTSYPNFGYHLTIGRTSE